MQAQTTRTRPTTNATMESPVSNILYLEAILKRKFNLLLKTKKYIPLTDKVTFLDVLDKLFKHFKETQEIVELEDFLDDELLTAGLNPNVPGEIKKQRRPCRHGLLPGTSMTKNRQKYVARINVNGKAKHLGVYETEEEAHSAFLAAKSNLAISAT